MRPFGAKQDRVVGLAEEGRTGVFEILQFSRTRNPLSQRFDRWSWESMFASVPIPHTWPSQRLQADQRRGETRKEIIPNK